MAVVVALRFLFSLLSVSGKLCFCSDFFRYFHGFFSTDLSADLVTVSGLLSRNCHALIHLNYYVFSGSDPWKHHGDWQWYHAYSANMLNKNWYTRKSPEYLTAQMLLLTWKYFPISIISSVFYLFLKVLRLS